MNFPRKGSLVISYLDSTCDGLPCYCEGGLGTRLSRWAGVGQALMAGPFKSIVICADRTQSSIPSLCLALNGVHQNVWSQSWNSKKSFLLDFFFSFHTPPSFLLNWGILQVTLFNHFIFFGRVFLRFLLLYIGDQLNASIAFFEIFLLLQNEVKFKKLYILFY